MSKNERTRWRDLRLNDRHRLWGTDSPAVDIDHFLEFDGGHPAILVEYKNELAEEPNPKHPSYQALIELADRAGLPILFVRYASDFSWWLVTPWNSQAKKWLNEQTKMGEVDYVRLLYKIRGRRVPEEVLLEISAVVRV